MLDKVCFQRNKRPPLTKVNTEPHTLTINTNSFPAIRPNNKQVKIEDIQKGMWGHSRPVDSKRDTVEQATSFLVEMHLGKVLVNGFRHKVAHILASTDL